MKNPRIEHAMRQHARQQLCEEQAKGQRFSDRPTITPDSITELQPDEVFVFGSNLKGHHHGGAANYALNHFGAKWGIGRGLSGQSYAIPTSRIPFDELKGYVDEFLQFARDHDDLLFYVTRIGCGNAGYTVEDIAPLFADAYELENVRLPGEFAATLNLGFDFKLEIQVPKAVKIQNYGQVRTLADLTMVLNAQKHYTNPELLIADLSSLLYLYRKRGTVTDDAIDSFKYMLGKNASKWFNDGYFDIDQMYAHLQDKAGNDATTALEVIYQRREMAKMARVVMLMNEVARYTDPQTLMMDVHNVLKYDGTPMAPTNWNDSFHYPYFFFEQGIIYQWKQITDKEGRLDNDKLNRVMFENHEKRIAELGLPEVIRRDYAPDSSCHPEVFFPNKAGTGPVYVEIKQDVFVKSCGEGKGPNRNPEMYEMQFLTPILERLCQGENPEYVMADGCYIPIRDYSRPVYTRFGKVYFTTEAEKKLYLMQQLKEYKARQKSK